MRSHRLFFSRLGFFGVTATAALVALVPSCSSDDSGTPSDGGQDSTSSSSSGSSSSGSSSGVSSSSGSGSSSGSSSSSGSGSSSGTLKDGGPDADAGDGAVAVAMCASPGKPTPGPVDDHCALDDGGSTVQPTSAA